MQARFFDVEEAVGDACREHPLDLARPAASFARRIVPIEQLDEALGVRSSSRDGGSDRATATVLGVAIAMRIAHDVFPREPAVGARDGLTAQLERRHVPTVADPLLSSLEVR